MDEAKLAPILAELEAFPEINLTGFTQKEIDEITAPLNPQEEEDTIPEPPATPITKTGDLWQLGKHRVLCGKSPDDIPKLLNGAVVGAVITDPPYGIGILRNRNTIGTFKGVVSQKQYEEYEGDDSPFDPTFLLTLAPITCIWGANYFHDKLPLGTKWLVWQKREGMETGVVFADCELAWTSINQAPRLFHHTWWGMIREGNKDSRERVHPSQKPTELMKWCIEELKVEGSILDPFLGSGTTLIAAEQLGRTCYGIEIEGRYCDVAVRRWMNLTGKQAVLESTGQTFDEVKAERIGKETN